MAISTYRPSAFRIWLAPFSILLGAGLVFFTFTYGIDAAAAGDPERAFALIFTPNPNSAASMLSNAAEVVAALLAIAITVVAIVVELASNRYTHRITELFVGEPVNFVVMGFFVVTALQSIWVDVTLDYTVDDAGRLVPGSFVPYWSMRMTMAMLAICLLVLLPYFAFVFHFLTPREIVRRIRTHTLEFIRGKRPGLSIARKQREAIRGVEQLADVAMNAMSNKDKGVSMASVDALKQLGLDYGRVRKELDPAWYVVEGEVAENPDFVSMSADVLRTVSERRVWFEMKILRQYQTLYGEALHKMRDINYVIAINTRQLAESAMANDDAELFALCVKFFNTYLRATINAKDVRTAYNVLHQYRLLAERALTWKNGVASSEIARHFKYYGRLSFDAKLPFILETVAYDLCQLNEQAFDVKSAASRDLLKVFLEVDKESEGEAQESSLRGVRKAQVKLATYYMVKGDNALAKEVHRDMEDERPERLASIRDELLAVQSSEFWEISDRGHNFDYLAPDRKAKMLMFFEWFGDVLPARPSLVAPISGEFLPAVAEAQRPASS